MDHKSLKQDLTYVIKRLQKDGKVLTVWDENLDIVDQNGTSLSGLVGAELSSINAHYVLTDSKFDPCEALIIVRAWLPSKEHIEAHFSKWRLARLGYTQCSYILPILVEATGINTNDWHQFFCGYDYVPTKLKDKNSYYDVGAYLREKFAPIA